MDKRFVIGDISVAVDNNQNVYINEGHVCGGIILDSKSPEGFRTIDDFLRTKIKKDAKTFSPWQKLMVFEKE